MRLLFDLGRRGRGLAGSEVSQKMECPEILTSSPLTFLGIRPKAMILDVLTILLSFSDGLRLDLVQDNFLQGCHGVCRLDILDTRTGKKVRYNQVFPWFVPDV